MPPTKADSVPLLRGSLPRIEVFQEESLLKIASFRISVPVFGLNACAGTKFLLDKSVGNVILLIRVSSKPVCRKVEPRNAEGCLVVDA
jgi:hypothetical protein